MGLEGGLLEDEAVWVEAASDVDDASLVLAAMAFFGGL